MGGEWFRHGWRCVELEPGVVHVRPVGDLIRHELDDDCVCGPTVEITINDHGADGHVHTHHALDGRD